MSTRNCSWRAAADLTSTGTGAARLGLTESQIDNAAGDGFAQAQVSTILQSIQSQQYHVVMEVAPEFWQSPQVLSNCMSALPAAQ